MKNTSIIAALICAVAIYSTEGSDLTALQRLDLIPLPAGVTVERNVDISKDPAFEFSTQHPDFTFLDPFPTERRNNNIPENFSLRFTTKASSREMFLFYKRFFNVESKKRESERTLPYYNSRSFYSFDQKNEADVTRDTEVGDASFYKMHVSGAEGREAIIVIFNDGKGGLTSVFIITYKEKS